VIQTVVPSLQQVTCRSGCVAMISMDPCFVNVVSTQMQLHCTADNAVQLFCSSNAVAISDRCCGFVSTGGAQGFGEQPICSSSVVQHVSVADTHATEWFQTKCG
jgi:hypothetical protein